MYQDTITAIATPIGKGGLGVIRISGSLSKNIAQDLFPHALPNRRLVYGKILNPNNQQVVDEAMVVYMPGPRTYTKEDVVEISCHGGPMPLQQILQLTIEKGARLANPGEFTLRAFLNGRIDLAQAEAVLDVISAETQASLRLAVDGIGGKLSKPIKEVRTRLMDVLAFLTARIDFPEDDVPNQETLEPIIASEQQLHRLISSADTGIIYRHGVRTAIVGKPNAGKSSLLNRILGENRAIVTPVPGTTRDTLEETISLDGVPFIFIDTAGIADTDDPVEQLGIERSRKAILESDLILLILDRSRHLSRHDHAIMELLSDQRVLVAANKTDLPQVAKTQDVRWPSVSISALTGDGMDNLQQHMVQMVIKGDITSANSVWVTNPRHKASLELALRHVQMARDSLQTEMPDDCVTIDLTAAITAIGTITGETVTEELLDTIFSRFCIGK